MRCHEVAYCEALCVLPIEIFSRGFQLRAVAILRLNVVALEITHHRRYRQDP